MPFIKTRVFGTGREILTNFSHALPLSCMVQDTNATADDNGVKFIKAGTPLGATGFKIRDREKTVLSPATDASQAVGIAMHDINVSDGVARDTVIFRGDVVYSNMDTDVQALFTDEMEKALSPQITLV
ncbi:hypothetical protein [Levilactobacillus andaensis]|uniref:hypothetical protein n=1 Tax=Levilactobacillus andaensis TaxID=2799570 RepID=UPI0019424D38|nr:hypothetical protein [Levilactobacillus andaensis]